MKYSWMDDLQIYVLFQQYFSHIIIMEGSVQWNHVTTEKIPAHSLSRTWNRYRAIVAPVQ